MMAKVDLFALFNIGPTGDSESLGRVVYCVTLMMTFDLGKPYVLTQNYTTRNYKKFCKDWGHVDGAVEYATAVKSGLVEKHLFSVDISEIGLRIDGSELC